MKRARMAIPLLAAAGLATSGCIPSSSADQTTPQPAGQNTTPTASAPADDVHGRQACEDLLDGGADGTMRARTVVVRGETWSDDEWSAWGSEVLDIADTAARSTTTSVRNQGRAVLDELSGGSFNPGHLFGATLELAQVCAAAELADPLLFVDALGVEFDATD